MDSLTKEKLFKKAQERFLYWAKMYSDVNVTAKQMYENMICPINIGDAAYDIATDSKPVLDYDLCFKYKGYDFEFSSCNNITRIEQIIGLTSENVKSRFPHGIFSDRYVCWIHGHKDIEGHTKEESDDPECWVPETYLVPDAWYRGATYDLIPGCKVEKAVLEAIDKFLETFKE